MQMRQCKGTDGMLQDIKRRKRSGTCKNRKRNTRHYNTLTLINLTNESVIISEYNQMTYHHYGNHGALPTCTIIMGLWV